MKKLFALLTLAFLVSPLFNSCSDDPLKPSSQIYPTSYTMNVTIDTVLAPDLLTFNLNGFNYRTRLLDCKCFDTVIGPILADQATKAKISQDSALKLGKAALEYAKTYLKTGKFTEFKRDSAYTNLNANNELLRRLNYDSTSYQVKLKNKGFLAPI